MADNIVSSKNLARAIAKEKDGIVLYWVEELGIAGIHVKGIMRLLGVQNSLVSDAVTSLETVRQIAVQEAEIVTESGLKTVRLILENDLPKVLRKIERSKAKEETRDRAGDIRDKLAAAGFKLMVMLELAPHQLKAQVDQHVSEVDKLLEIERLKYKTQELHNSALTLHGSAWLALQGVGIAEIETVVTEIVQPETGRTAKILTADQLKTVVKERTGQKLHSLKWFADKLRSAGRDDLLIAVTRHTTNEYPVPERLNEALRVVYGEARQQLIGE